MTLTVLPLKKGQLRLSFLVGTTVWALWAVGLSSAWANPDTNPNRIYRCGNEYTNLPGRAKSKSCILIMQGYGDEQTKNKNKNKNKIQTRDTPHRFNDKTEKNITTTQTVQTAKDHDAHLILEAERKNVQEQLIRVEKTWNHGSPTPLPNEVTDKTAYQTRVQELREEKKRLQADLVSLDQELARFKYRDQK
jgi:hypothetical protein